MTYHRGVTSRIQALIPGTDWFVVYTGCGDGEEPVYAVEPLVGWALVRQWHAREEAEDAGDVNVVGVVNTTAAMTELVDALPGVWGYLHRSQLTADGDGVWQPRNADLRAEIEEAGRADRDRRDQQEALALQVEATRQASGQMDPH
jgi:hypothetical protein